MSKHFTTIALSVILAASAADAAPAVKSLNRTAEDVGKQVYCLKFADQTGSHLNRTDCRTKKEWKQLGVDIDEVLADAGRSGGQA